jgi:outer membrane protein OmpA-like peptidoglycan-associated protein
MKLRPIFILVITMLVSLPAQANEYNKLIRKGNKYFQAGFYDEAVKHYIKAEALNPGDPHLLHRVGVTYLESSFKNQAIKYLEQAFEKDSVVDKNIHFQLGLGYQYNNQFLKALEHYHIYRKTTDFKFAVDRHIRECNIGIEFYNNSKTMKIVNVGMPLNSDNEDYAPLILADGSAMIFTSRREGSTGGKLAFDNNYFEDIYISHQKSGNWTEPEKISSNINTENHECAVALSPDGEKLFLYDDENNGDFYVSFKQGDEWTTPKEMGKPINSRYREISLSINREGNRIFFSSDRPGGYGGFDIWMSELTADSTWGEPVNLGPNVNTPDNEDAPFIHPDDNILYFSSTGHMGMGGYDIYMSKELNKEWIRPRNLGYPINTVEDDIYFVVDAENRFGYYATAREDGLGGYDIYKIFLNEKTKKGIKEDKDEIGLIASTDKLVVSKNDHYVQFSGKVVDADSLSPLGAKVVFSDLKKQIVMAVAYTNPETGEFDIAIPKNKDLGLTVEKEGYLFNSQTLDREMLASVDELKKDFTLSKAKVGNKVALRNIFFDSGKSEIKEESMAELDRIYELLMSVPQLKVQINGHTDNTGDAKVNKVLSKRRARSVVDYLISYGIDPSRLSYKGFGEGNPIASNDQEKEGRELNRRTEIEIIAN